RECTGSRQRQQPWVAGARTGKRHVSVGYRHRRYCRTGRAGMFQWPSRDAGGRWFVYNRSRMVTVLLFASVAEKAGTRRLELPANPGDTVAHLRDRLLERFPQLEPMVPNLLYALDEEYVRTDAPVSEGATLAVIPPVSGG